MAFRIRIAAGVLSIAVLFATALLGAGCGGDDDGSERAVQWGVDRQLGPKSLRLSATIEGCNPDPPLLQEPIIEYEGNRAYVELRQTPEDGKGICFLNLPIAFKKITFERDLDELVLFDASTDPPEKRWPTERPLPPERRWPSE
jgi:hypothetical protein